MSSKKLFSALREDAQQGWVWLRDTTLPARSIVKITNIKNGKVVYCEALQIDENFLYSYNQSPRITISNPGDAIVINAWYRTALGNPSPQSDVSINIVPSNCWWGKFRACTDHPQIIVRVAVWLGATGLLLGVVSLGMGVLSIYPLALPSR